MNEEQRIKAIELRVSALEDGCVSPTERSQYLFLALREENERLRSEVLTLTSHLSTANQFIENERKERHAAIESRDLARQARTQLERRISEMQDSMSQNNVN